MARTPTTEEYKELTRKLRETAEHVKGDKKEALRVLMAAGIVDENGQLKWPYNEGIGPRQYRFNFEE